ncbi:MAG: glycosyltransferase [Opitutales bacterium]
MRIAVVHYHYQRGGVTQVVRQALDGLARVGADLQVAALAGPPAPTPDAALTWTVVPGLGYASADTAPDPAKLLRDLRSAAKRALGGTPDVWHIHNPTLGKNPSWPAWIQALAEAGERLVLQPHDFAEDSRGENYALLQEHRPAGTHLYPVADHIRWAPINRRDAEHLRTAGLPDRWLNPLPNPVVAPDNPSGRDLRPELGCDRLLLYPVRITRRKNLGELLLAACLAPRGTLLGNTLDITNPNEAAGRDYWRQLIKALGLPVRLGLGTPTGGDFAFDDLVVTAEQLVTTSVAEGFGLAFLEPWLWGKPLTGRNLPGITRDFVGKGVSLPGLYDRLDVPLDWLDKAELRRALQEALTRTYAAYRRPVPEDAVDRAWAAWVSDDGRIDFGVLNEAQQSGILHRLVVDPEADKAVSRFPGQSRAASETLRVNRTVIRKQYSLTAYATRLVELYRKLAQSPVGPVEALDANRLLDCYLRPEALTLLRA